MSKPEWKIRSIPSRTSLDVLRGGVEIRIGGVSLLGGVRRVSRQPTAAEPDWSQTVAKHVFQKPPRRERAKPEPLYEIDRKIEWEAEVIEGYNGNDDLGIILEFVGIRLTRGPFLRSRHNRPDSPVFYIPTGYNNGLARLFLATRGDIFEAQVVPSQMGVNPFFQNELHLPQLTTTYDPASMTVLPNNGLVTIGYNPRTYL